MRCLSFAHVIRDFICDSLLGASCGGRIAAPAESLASADIS